METGYCCGKVTLSGQQKDDLRFASASGTDGEDNGTLLQYSCLANPMDGGAWKAAVHGVAEGWTRLSDFTFTFHALEKEMATHSRVLAWRIPGRGEPGGLPSMGSHKVGHDWSDLAAAGAAGTDWPWIIMVLLKISLLIVWETWPIIPTGVNQNLSCWSWVASACSGLEWGLGSKPEIEARSWWWEYQSLANRPVVSDKGPGLQLCRKEFLQRWKVVKQVFIIRKKSTVYVDRYTGRLRGRAPESCPQSSLHYFYGTFLLVSLWPIILICLVQSPYLVYLRILSNVLMHLLAKMDSTEEAYG